jgi:glycerol-3-phosphate acyltransferase PlsY
MEMRAVFAGFLAYLLGNFSSAYVLGRIVKKQDIRDFGSGNAGATNAGRTFGKQMGVATLALDMIKGMAAVFLGGLIFGEQGRFIGAIFVVIGHVWPVVLGFRGGKGVATSAGALVALDYRLLFVLLGVFILVAILTRIVSLSSIAAAVTAPFATLFLHGKDNKEMVIAVVLLAAIVLYKHRENMIRILNGTEKKFIFAKKE